MSCVNLLYSFYVNWISGILFSYPFYKNLSWSHSQFLENNLRFLQCINIKHLQYSKKKFVCSSFYGQIFYLETNIIKPSSLNLRENEVQLKKTKESQSSIVSKILSPIEHIFGIVYFPTIGDCPNLAFNFMKELILNNRDLARSKNVFTKDEFFNFFNLSGLARYFNCLK